jgi:hypothetical protein
MLMEHRERCVQLYFFSGKAFPPGDPDPADIWAILWDLLPPEAQAGKSLSKALHLHSSDA